MTISQVKSILKSMRKHNRRAVVLPVELSVDGRKFFCTAYDVSLGGVRLKVGMSINNDVHVTVKLKDKLIEVARVVWSAEGFVGLSFLSGPNAIKTGLGELAIHLN